MKLLERIKTRCSRALAAALFALPFMGVHAQPGDVNGIDIRLVESSPTQLEVQLRANNPWDWTDGVGNLTFAIRWETAAGGTLIGNSTQGFDDCMNDGLRLLGNPGISNVDEGGFRYRGYNCTGGGWADGDGCAYPANTWIPYARINVTGLTGCANFEVVVSDAYTASVNSNWFISLGGVNITANSQVVGPAVELGVCNLDCEGIAGGPALPGSPCDDGNPCTSGETWDLDCNCTGGVFTGTTNTTTETACDSYTWSVNNVTYTESGTYTVVDGCDTQILVLTITESTSATTTVSECDSYTWSVNNVTYTESGTYTVVDGCDTQILVLTITESTTATTTETACDSYTWSVNNVTYTESGTYTVVTGCSTQILVLTITESTTATTTETACDSYTWSVNNVTYTESGTYTVVDGCDTQILVLTITESTSATTTVSECDSYTWSVNNVTYTESGTYTVVDGCDTQILVLTILQSGTNTTTETACDSYTWSVNNVTYTESGTYTVVTGCSTEILVLTITESTTATTTETACDSYTWSVNNVTYTESGTYTVVDGCDTQILVLTILTGQVCLPDCEGVIGGTALPGTACDDGNPNTFNDTWDPNCDCVGIPVGGCDNELTLEFATDANGSQIAWEILPIGSSTAICSGGNLPSNAQGVLQTCCLPDGCYRLVVTDAGGDGIVGGGYMLRTSGVNGQRIIDNQNNGAFGSVSAIANGEGFCVPIGTDLPIYTSCDKYWWRTGEYLVATPNAAVSAEWLEGAPNTAQSTTSGYEFWFFNPNGGYTFRRFRSHRQSDGFGPASAFRACHMKVNNWAIANHIPQFDLMNVRVRGRVNNVNFEWGPACRFVRDEALAQCPPTKLMDIPGNQFLSCGQFRQFISSQRVHARPVGSATQYQWRFRLPAEGVEIVRTSTSYFLNLGWTDGQLLQDGQTYDVDVRAFRNGAWCIDPLNPDSVWGDVCLLTIQNIPAQGGSQNLALNSSVDMSIWPNPNRGDQLWLSLSEVAEDVNTVAVDIFDMFGKRVSAREIAVQDGNVNTVLDLAGDLAGGVYLVHVIAGDRIYTERLVIQP